MQDRSFNAKLKRPGDTDKPNTKLTEQRKLNNLYLGKDFHYVRAVSRMGSMLMVVMLFSSGMPMMYLLGFFFYACTYAVHKVLLITFYTNNQGEFTHYIP